VKIKNEPFPKLPGALHMGAQMHLSSAAFHASNFCLALRIKNSVPPCGSFQEDSRSLID
jgi:hypothetical protein